MFSKVLSTLAFLIAILALVIGIAAYNRAGQDIEQVVDENIQQALDDLDVNVEEPDINADVNVEDDITAARYDARMELQDIQNDLEAGADFSEVEDKWIAVRTDLGAAYENTTGELAQQGDELDQEMEQVEAGLRDDTADALDGLEDLIANLERDVRTDEQ